MATSFNQETASKLHWWQRKEIIIAFIIGALVLIAVLIFAAHAYRWDTTITTTTEVTRLPQQKVTATETGKTLLDWLQLLGVLAIPIVVAVGTAVFTTQQTRISEANRKQQHDTDVQIAENQQQEELLRTYFDKLSDLLLNEKLNSNSNTTSNIQSIVRARTLAVLHIINAERKDIVLRFLHDSDLLQYVKDFLYSIDLSHTDLNRVNLNGADLSGADLREADLSAAKLYKANLHRAELYRADLCGANLRGANLNIANLSHTNLNAADLSHTNLNAADLSHAILREADLRGADLSGADLREADLSDADLSGANLWKVGLRGADITSKQLEKAENVTPEQFAQIKLPESAATQEAKMA